MTVHFGRRSHWPVPVSVLMLVLASALALTLTVGCRTGQPLEPVESARSDGAPGVEPATTVDASVTPREAAPAETQISGFDRGGAITCLPLDPQRRCLERPDPLKDACGAARGQVLRCEDCRPLCSVPLK